MEEAAPITFLEIPTELRLIVYSHHATATRNVISGAYHDRPHVAIFMASFAPLPTKRVESKRYITQNPFQILYTCRKIHDEAFDILYFETRHRINALSYKFVKQPMALGNRHHEVIKRLEIQIDWNKLSPDWSNAPTEGRGPGVRWASYGLWECDRVKENIDAICAALAHFKALEDLKICWRQAPKDTTLKRDSEGSRLHVAPSSIIPTIYYYASTNCARCDPTTGPPAYQLLQLLAPLKNLRNEKLQITLSPGSAMTSAELAEVHANGHRYAHLWSPLPENLKCFERPVGGVESTDDDAVNVMDMEEWRESTEIDTKWLTIANQRSQAKDAGHHLPFR